MLQSGEHLLRWLIPRVFQGLYCSIHLKWYYPDSFHQQYSVIFGKSRRRTLVAQLWVTNHHKRILHDFPGPAAQVTNMLQSWRSVGNYEPRLDLVQSCEGKQQLHGKWTNNADLRSASPSFFLVFQFAPLWPKSGEFVSWCWCKIGRVWTFYVLWT